MIKLAVCFVALLLGSCAVSPAGRWGTDVKILHLRSGLDAEWDDFKGTPDGRDLKRDLTLEPLPGGGDLLLFQEGVKKTKWIVELNGQRLGELPLQEEPLVSRFHVAAAQVRPGANALRILAPKEPDDIRVGVIGLGDFPGVPVEVSVLETGRGSVPSRITVVDDALGALAPLVADPAPLLAVRPGVIYTASGHAKFKLPPGRYTITASRGFEYGIDVQHLKLEAGQGRSLAMTIRREVPTPRWIACDTHVHTLTLSGHGDCTLEERLVTLAGEGVELPVATEHNQHASYRDAAAKLGVDRFFTPVDGNEVTTKKGHYNVFPVRPGAPVPDWKEEDRGKLLASIRTSGASIAILNHPRSVHDKFVPFDAPHFDGETARDVGGYGYDALELINSGALRTDFMEPYRGWFALLNRGIRVVGVGASDSHDVSRFIVGQSRTYIAGPDEAPGAIDVEGAARALAEGRALVSLGLLVNMRVADRFAVGDLATGLGAEFPVTVTVHGPAWTHVDHVTLYANGIPLRDESQAGARTGGLKLSFTWRIPRPAHDVHLVAIATGPAPEGLHGPLPRPYQPSSTTWVPRVIGSTNPVWIDADGDGQFLAARAIAQRLVDAKADPSKYDEAVRLHVKDLLVK